MPGLFDRGGLAEIDQRTAGVNIVLEAKLRGVAPSPEMIERPRLTAGLLDSRGALVLLAAPPGFGKTTLLAQWRAVDERPFAWLSLDAADNDPVVFWTGIVEAIRRVRPDFGGVAEIALRATHVDVLDALIPLILHELEAIDDEIVLLLDDYQFVENATCHKSLTFFMDSKPTNVQLVLSSRSDPPIPVAKLRAAGELHELRALELCFTEDEQASFLNERLSLGLAADILAVLHERTEGWPAGVYLASLTLRSTDDPVGFVEGFGGSNRHVVDYLTEVVLTMLAPEQRSFLLETSILESLSASLCDAVTRRGRSADRLVELERANLFLIPLDDRRERYRYHQLFAGLLEAQLEQRQPELVPELHRRACEWLESAGDLDGAIRHALAAGELEAASKLLARQWVSDPHAHLGRAETICRRLEDFPAAAIEEDARLALIQAWALSMLNEHEDAGEGLAAAERMGEGVCLPDGTDVEAAAGLARACFARGNVTALLAAAEAVREDELAPGWHPVSSLALGRARYLAGDHAGAVDPLERAASLGNRLGRVLVSCVAQGLLARIAVAVGDLDIAEARARDALEGLDRESLSDRPGAGTAHVALGAVLARRGEMDEAGDLLVRGLARLRVAGDALEIADALLVYAPVRRSLDTLSAARAVVEEAKTLLASCPDPGALRGQLEDVVRTLTPAHRRIEGESELTERELEVLRYLAEGLPKRDIGRMLFLSYNTIHSHTKSIYQKLRVSSRQAAVDRARELGAL